MNAIAIARLTEERKKWRKDHPPNFVAKCEKKPDGSLDYSRWSCEIPGAEGSDWEKGVYKMKMKFSSEYPTHPPKCILLPPVAAEGPFYHMNVYPDGEICLDIIGSKWSPGITIKEILTGVQTMLTDPNPGSPAQPAVMAEWRSNRAMYNRKVKLQAAKCIPDV